MGFNTIKHCRHKTFHTFSLRLYRYSGVQPYPKYRVPHVPKDRSLFPIVLQNWCLVPVPVAQSEAAGTTRRCTTRRAVNSCGGTPRRTRRVHRAVADAHSCATSAGTDQCQWLTCFVLTVRTRWHVQCNCRRVLIDCCPSQFHFIGASHSHHRNTAYTAHDSGGASDVNTHGQGGLPSQQEQRQTARVRPTRP